MAPNRWNQRRLKLAALYLGAWAVFGTFTAIKVYYAQLLWDKPVPWDLAFRRSFKEVFSYALCVLGALWWCGRLRPWFTARRSRWISGHALGAAVFALAHLTLVSWMEAGEKSVQTGEPMRFGYLFSQLALHYSLSSFIEYWVVVFAHLGWRYYQGYRERELQAAALATELVQARLQALRMQINPHFLFNTLNTIAALVHEQPEAAERMIARLSDLLRRTLDRGDVQEVPLREELDFLKSYLEIEQVRFPDRLSVTFDIEPRANDLLVPHLILQPLVENALRHGIMPCEEPGRVAISASLAGGDKLEIKVWNNGLGLSDSSGCSAPRAREGIGLGNVRSRLLQLYGGAQEFSLDNAPGGGVVACLRIPCHTSPRAESPRVVVMSEPEAVHAGLTLPAVVTAEPKRA